MVKIIDSCENNPQVSSATKIGEHTPHGYLFPTVWGFENKYSLYCGKDRMKEFSKSLKEHVTKKINVFEKKKYVAFDKERVKILQRSR